MRKNSVKIIINLVRAMVGTRLSQISNISPPISGLVAQHMPGNSVIRQSSTVAS